MRKRGHIKKEKVKRGRVRERAHMSKGSYKKEKRKRKGFI